MSESFKDYVLLNGCKNYMNPNKCDSNHMTIDDCINCFAEDEAIWDHQQSKIDQLEKDKNELIDYLIELLKESKDNEDFIIDHGGFSNIDLHSNAAISLSKLTGKSIEELL